MIKVREDIEADEKRCLSSYGQRVSETAGRRFSEPEHPVRTAFQRDRARIIHSRAFRRLEYKTQVFLNGTGDHLRTRLTHTIEVASVSRTIARALGANEDLAEAIALAHDLGHAPFGHAGEEKLNELMAGAGGFEHNVQSRRIVELIESTYPSFPGLNLSYEVVEGLRKHDEGYVRRDIGTGEEVCFPSPSLEAQIANYADEITYYSHDLDDGFQHDLLQEEQLEEIELWNICGARVRTDFPDLSGVRRRSYVIRMLLDYEVDGLLRETRRRLHESGVEHADDVRRFEAPLVGYGGDLRRQNGALRKFLYQNLYFHDAVAVPNQRGCDMIGAVFAYYMEHPDELGSRTAERIEGEGLERTVCDYVSGMTDRYIADEVKRIG
ncbi:MAG: deoxyguanosinetriphosphate triphosphohydrolase [Verrucomicrobiota bacterium]